MSEQLNKLCHFSQDFCIHCGACSSVCYPGALVMNPDTRKLEFDPEQDIETATQLIRTDWRLGQNSIPSVVEMLEDNHIKVVEVDEPLEFDGLSSMIDNNIPVIVVNKNFPVERKRFTLLHELGHLLMNLPD